jgi:O-antigen ligase
VSSLSAEMTRRAPAALASSGARRLVGQGLRWQVLVTIPASLILAALITYSLRGAISWVIVVCIVGLHRHRRSWGIYALLAFWCVAPEIRRVMDQLTGYQASDPLSLAPFIATALLAAIEFYEYRLPVVVRRVLLLALIGFVVGLPVGILHPRSGLYALAAYAFGVAALVLGANESRSLNHGTLRRFLLVGAPLVALYAIFAQRLLPLPSWERAWLGDVSFNSIGANAGGQVRVFGTLNAPGTLAPLLGLALLAYLTTHPARGRGRGLAVIAAAVLAIALELTFVRSSWLALPIAALVHVVASRGRSARLVLGVGVAVIGLTLILSPVSSTAHQVVNRAATFAHLGSDVSVNTRSATFQSSFPSAARAPLGHGLGTAGTPSALNTAQADLAVPDDGYLSLIYQVGPLGFLLVVAALLVMVRAAWTAARSGPDQEEGAALLAMLVFMLIVLGSGDAFYGLGGLTLWFLGGQALRLAGGHPRPVIASPPSTVALSARA